MSVYLYEGDCLQRMRELAVSVDICITSPPYFQKFDYERAGQYGLEPTVDEFVRVQVRVFEQDRRLMIEGGTCFIVIGDTSNNYSPVRAKGQRKSGDKNWLCRRSLQVTHREKETLSVPFRLAAGLREAGWVHRSTLVWDKGRSGVMANSDTAPECHEYILHMIKWSKNGRPYGNSRPLRSSVLHHSPAVHKQHGCVFPESLAGELLSVFDGNQTVIDPYIGSGTVALAAPEHSVYGFDLDCSVAKTACEARSIEVEMR